MAARVRLLVAVTVLLSAAAVAHACTTNAECDDGNPCDGTEVCQAGTCVYGYPLNCSDGNPDTMEWCDPLTGCRHQVTTSFARCSERSAGAFTWVEARDACACVENGSHADYVRCVWRTAVEHAARELPRECRSAIRRCAARSTCGKPSGFVACCASAQGACLAGVCQDGTTPCAAAQDCPRRSRCSLEPSADACRLRGGAPSTGGSCCDLLCAP